MAGIGTRTNVNLDAATDLCPCGSRQILGHCCYRGGAILRPTPWAAPSSRPGKRGANHRCYACALGECGDKVSREHFISATVLRLLRGDDTVVGVSGLTWQGGRQTYLPIDALASNILCDRHNHDLSGLDAIAARFVGGANQAMRPSTAVAPTNPRGIYLFNGHDIERWLLKVLCGSVFSGNAAAKGVSIPGWYPIPGWLDILFARAAFPPGTGLYLQAEIGSVRSFSGNRLRFNVITHDQAGVYGLVFGHPSFQFVLAMGPPPTSQQGTPFEHAIYRPKKIVFREGERVSMLIFGWDTPGDGRDVEIIFRPGGE